MGEVTFLDVSKRFSLRVDGEVHHVQALDRINFTVKDGEIVALIGPSGCGKTTALRVAMGLDAASAGRITGGGLDHGVRSRGARLRPWSWHGVSAGRTASVAFRHAERDVRAGNERYAWRAVARDGRKVSSACGSARLAKSAAASAFRRHETACRHCARACH